MHRTGADFSLGSAPVLLAGWKASCSFFFLGATAVYGQQYNYENFLGLSPQQTAAVRQLNGDYNDWTDGKVKRIVQVDIELLQEESRSPLNTNALGVRYSELEVIRRERVDRLNKLRVQIRTYLTATQLETLKVLKDTNKYQYEARGALCANYFAWQSFGLCGRNFAYDPTLLQNRQTLTDFLKFSEEQDVRLNDAKGRWFKGVIVQSEIGQQIWSRLCQAESAHPLVPESIGSAHAEDVL